MNGSSPFYIHSTYIIIQQNQMKCYLLFTRSGEFTLYTNRSIGSRFIRNVLSCLDWSVIPLFPSHTHV